MRPASACVGGLTRTGQAGRAEGVRAIPLVHGAHAALAAVSPLRVVHHLRLHAHRVRGPAELHKVRRGEPPEPAANVLATARMPRLALRPCVEGLLRGRGGEVALVHAVGELRVFLVVRRLIRFCATARSCSARRSGGTATVLPSVGLRSVVLCIAYSGVGGLGLGGEPLALSGSVITPFLQREAIVEVI